MIVSTASGSWGLLILLGSCTDQSQHGLSRLGLDALIPGIPPARMCRVFVTRSTKGFGDILSGYIVYNLAIPYFHVLVALF